MNETWFSLFSAEGSALFQIWFDLILFDDRRQTEQYHGLPALDIIDGEKKKGMKLKRKMGREEILYSDMCYLLAISHANFYINSCANPKENNAVYHWPRFIVGLYKMQPIFKPFQYYISFCSTYQKQQLCSLSVAN